MGIGQRKRVLLGVNLGRAIVTNLDFTTYVCDSASTVGAAVWGGAHRRSQDFQRVVAPRVDPGFLVGDDGGPKAPSDAR